MKYSRLLYIPLFILIFISFVSFTTENSYKKKVTLTVHPGDCDVEQMHAYQFMGLEFIEIKAEKKNKDGDFVFRFPFGKRHFYYIGPATNNVRPVVIGQEKALSLTADCVKMRNAKVVGSEDNKTYDLLMPRIQKILRTNGQLSQQFQRDMQQKKDLKPIVLKYKSLDQERLTLIQDMGKINPYFEAIASLYGYLSFQNNQGTYKNELDYYTDKYYGLILKDSSIYNRMPHVYESSKSYAQPLMNIRASEEVKIAALEKGLKIWDEGTPAHRMALGAYIQTAMGKHNDLYVYFGNQFVKLYGKEYPAVTARLKKRIKSVAGLSMGGEAIDILMKDTEGNERKLSDLRGKVVLIDFWASWCGPCRKENPHVAKVYKKYKDAGFEIFGVSLDSRESSWKAAIKKDGLNWLNVSDLKGWQNAAAQMYGVRSIPYALLIDRDGKIIGQRMRGPSLDRKLKEVFGF